MGFLASHSVVDGDAVFVGTIETKLDLKKLYEKRLL